MVKWFKDKYRITAVLKVETDIITSIVESPVERAAILVIMFVKTFRTDVTVIGNIIMSLTSHSHRPIIFSIRVSSLKLIISFSWDQRKWSNYRSMYL